MEAATSNQKIAPGGVMMVAGEASADHHGAAIVRHLGQNNPSVPLFGVGGRAMRDAGFEAIFPAEQMAIAGLTEVLLALPRMARTMRRLVKVAKERQPRVVVLIDLPDFNLRLAKKLKALGIPVIYYISPQIWAWRQGRVRQIRDRVDRMLVILPFEETFYQTHDVKAEFVGHPLVHSVPAPNDNPTPARQALDIPTESGPVLAILPGSRRKEVERHLPPMLEALKRLRQRYPTLRGVLPIASTIDPQWVQALAAPHHDYLHVVDGQSHTAIEASQAAVVCSGTATLQTALQGKPMVVVYKASWLTYRILKRLIRVAHIALVNLIARRRLVPELIQDDVTPENIERAILPLLRQTRPRKHMVRALHDIRQQLGRRRASERVADIVASYLSPADSTDNLRRTHHGHSSSAA